MGGRPRADHREGVRGRGHIRHQGKPTGIPADAVGGRENPSEHSHHVEDRPAGSRQVRAGDGEEGNPRRGVRDTPAGGEHPDGGTRGNPRRGADGRHGGVLQPPALTEHTAGDGLQRPARPVQRAQGVGIRRGQGDQEVRRGRGHGTVRAADVRGVRGRQGHAGDMRRVQRAGTAHDQRRRVRRQDHEQDAPKSSLYRRVSSWRHRGPGRDAGAGRREDVQRGAGAVRIE